MPWSAAAVTTSTSRKSSGGIVAGGIAGRRAAFSDEPALFRDCIARAGVESEAVPTTLQDSSTAAQDYLEQIHRLIEGK